jgi:hypothetical protein
MSFIKFFYAEQQQIINRTRTREEKENKNAYMCWNGVSNYKFKSKNEMRDYSGISISQLPLTLISHYSFRIN